MTHVLYVYGNLIDEYNACTNNIDQKTEALINDHNTRLSNSQHFQTQRNLVGPSLSFPNTVSNYPTVGTRAGTQFLQMDGNKSNKKFNKNGTKRSCGYCSNGMSNFVYDAICNASGGSGGSIDYSTYVDRTSNLGFGVVVM